MRGAYYKQTGRALASAGQENQMMTRKELHEALDDALDSLRNGDKLAGFSYVLVADLGDTSEVCAGGRNVDPRMSLYAIMYEIKQRNGHSQMIDNVMDALAKLDDSKHGADLLRGDYDKLPPGLRDAAKNLIAACKKQGRKPQEDVVELPPQRPPRTNQ